MTATAKPMSLVARRLPNTHPLRLLAEAGYADSPTPDRWDGPNTHESLWYEGSTLEAWETGDPVTGTVIA